MENIQKMASVWFIIANKSFEGKVKQIVMIHFEDEETKK